MAAVTAREVLVEQLVEERGNLERASEYHADLVEGAQRTAEEASRSAQLIADIEKALCVLDAVTTATIDDHHIRTAGTVTVGVVDLVQAEVEVTIGSTGCAPTDHDFQLAGGHHGAAQLLFCRRCADVRTLETQPRTFAAKED